jgi:predicted AlkP superfamily pyrophosphatase or phosphodiesterase
VNRRNTVVLAVATLLASANAPAPQAQAPAAATPRLLVTIVIDQMRFDYVDRYGGRWNAGLKRLVTEGAVFERAMYPYLNTVTCAGHATIGTGAFPYRHGIIMNEWYRRDIGRRRQCTDDESVASVAYTAPAEPVGHSARRLRVPTLSERLRTRSPQSRVISLSMKPRSAVMLAGRGATAVTWFADSNVWGTSTAYSSAPVPEIQTFVADNPVDRERTAIWDRVRGSDEYVGPDDSRYERARAGWTSSFPHPLAGDQGAPATRFFDLWERSPFSDAYLGRLAAAVVREFKLGQRDAVDHLAVSFSAVDYVGHDFGPESHEVQDALFRLDQTLGTLFAVLDKAVGRDKYVVGVSADHGVSRIPEAMAAEGGDAGRVLNQTVQKVAEAAMRDAHGEGSYVALVEYTNVYLTPAARAKAQADPSFIAPLLAAVTKLPGIERVFSSAGLIDKRTSADPIERAAAISHHPDESGDVVVVLKPNWIGTNTSAATHGSARWYDQHVPVIFMGAGIKPGRYSTAASPADLAPTLAATIGLAMRDVDGKVLTDALRERPRIE